MRLDELKQRMSELDRVLDKTNSTENINMSAFKTAQSRLLGKIRKMAVSSFVYAAILAVFIALGLPRSISFQIKVLFEVFLLLYGTWYSILHFRLHRIDIAVLSPATLLAKTARLRLMMISGEVFFIVGIVSLIVYATIYDPEIVDMIIVSSAVSIIICIKHYWPQYFRLIRDLNSVTSV